MPESGTSGSVRGASSNGCSYRDSQDARRWRHAEMLAMRATRRRWWTHWVGACTCAGTSTRRPRPTASSYSSLSSWRPRACSTAGSVSCPLSYRSGNAPDKRDVLGTLMLAMLAGHKRYAHITALRGDAVAAQALGMSRIVSEDALRRAMERIDEAASTEWMRPSLMHSVREALDRPWVLDIDASIKPLYGRQEGAEVGYNPAKPMRPSHVLHTFLVGNLRLVLDVQVSTGKQHTSGHAKAALGRLARRTGPTPAG